MSIEYYELSGLTEITAKDLVLPRSKSLYCAIQHHREFNLVRILRREDEKQHLREYLMVDVTCDQVPSIDAFGILYRERLILEVLNDEKQLVNVIALRKDFPIILHQMQTRMGTPAQLCLYFDSPSNVHRTWTPQSFLKRILWWLEKSSRGELHPADQAVEGLFFASPYELVLPWNFTELKNAGTSFTFLKSTERPNGATYFAWPKDSSGIKSSDRSIATEEFELPALLHGQVEQDPANLGDMVELFRSKNIDLIEILKERLQLKEGTVAQASSDQDTLLILMHIPMKRSENSESEGFTRRAFIVPTGPLRLGIEIGFLAEVEGNIINDVMGQMDRSAEAQWRLIGICPMAILYFNNAEKARLKSGIVDAGPSGVLIGAGALGSTMLDLWVRSGWGSWVVIDDDHLKPHNLIRHPGLAVDVGVSKAVVAAQHTKEITLGAVEVSGQEMNGCDFIKEPTHEARKNCSLIVDASTSLDYPRDASQRDDLPRHISVFLTPNGNSAVLLAEDRERTIRLRNLEAQYYRALINDELGNHNIGNSQGTFISGSSCRDISLIMPYSKIMNHASTLAEHVISASSINSAVISVWNRNETNGSVSFYQVPVEPDHQLAFEEINIYIDKGLEQKLRTIREQALPNETGGILLGYHDLNINAIVIVDALQAPQDSKASPGSFERGIEGTKETVQAIASKTAEMVNYIGEWHSHPRGHSAKPSRDDYFQLVFLSLGMAEDGLPAVSLIVGEDDMQVLKCEAK